jgi:hypothetical protein
MPAVCSRFAGNARYNAGRVFMKPKPPREDRRQVNPARQPRLGRSPQAQRQQMFVQALWRLHWVQAR